jgi:hypothetical protein
LTDPPYRIGDELDIDGEIEALCRFDEADVSFVNELQLSDAACSIVSGHADDKSEVCRNEFVDSPGFIVLHTNNELPLLLLIEHLKPIDISKIERFCCQLHMTRSSSRLSAPAGYFPA